MPWHTDLVAVAELRPPGFLHFASRQLKKKSEIRKTTGCGRSFGLVIRLSNRVISSAALGENSILSQRRWMIRDKSAFQKVPEASSIHFDLGLSAPYLDLPFLRSGIPSKSLTPRIRWDFTPGESFTLPPLTKTIECSCEL